METVQAQGHDYLLVSLNNIVQDRRWRSGQYGNTCIASDDYLRGPTIYYEIISYNLIAIIETPFLESLFLGMIS